MPVISQRELDKLRTGQGVYKKLREPEVIRSLKVSVIAIFEASFRDYARAHKGCDAAMENREWERMKKFLLKYL